MGGAGSVLLGGISSLASMIGPIISLGLEILKAVTKALESIGKIFGIIEEDDNAEDLGDKALQCDMEPEDFESYQEYLDHIRDFQLDPEKSKTFSEEQKLAAGGLVIEKALEEKTGQKMDDFLLNVVSKDINSFTSDKINNYIKTFSEAGVDLNKVSDLKNGKITDIDEKNEINNLIDKSDFRK